MSDDSDEQLVRASRDGDEAAFATLYRRYEVRLLRYLFQLCRSVETAEDLFQETLLEVIRAERVPCEDGLLAPWLFTVARHKHLNRTRAEKRYQTAVARIDHQKKDTADAESILSETQERTQKAAAFEQAMRQLPEALRDICSMRLSGLSLEDISKVLGVPIGTVKSRLSRVLQRIKEDLT